MLYAQMAQTTREARSQASISRALDTALELFSSQGFGATSMRQIAEDSGISVGNLYHHFPNKEAIFRRLIQDYWQGLQEPDHPLARLFQRAAFPDDLEEMAEVIGQVVEENAAYILLFYVDVIEFRGEHIRAFYEDMARNFRQVYGDSLAERQNAGEFGDVDPLVAVMVATRWFFYFYTVEKCFGMPMHLGLEPKKATEEFIRLLRNGLLPRSGGEASTDRPLIR
ncbi:MAG: TetR/AcrR family transcriptional regulator [Thermoanaerobaculia bacterium]